jgi:hypothetical protein
LLEENHVSGKPAQIRRPGCVFQKIVMIILPVKFAAPAASESLIPVFTDFHRKSYRRSPIGNDFHFLFLRNYRLLTTVETDGRKFFKKHRKRKVMKKTAFCILLILLAAAAVCAQTTAFTYQGRLNDSSAEANGTYDFQFELYDATSAGSQVGSTQTLTNVAVSGGIFTVQLDFGANAFPGANRFLEIRVKKISEASYTTLTPRQPVTSAPYAVRSLNATNVEATTAGNSVVNAINDGSTSVTINDNRLPSNIVRIKPDTQQQSSSSTDGTDPLINLGGSYTVAPNTFQSTFRVNQDGGFFVSGTAQTIDAVPTTGQGTRMMWYPRKAAFRAGFVFGAQWDESNIGFFSNAFGRNSRASGDFSFAGGIESVASNIGSFAFGEANFATGRNSVALGRGAHTNARQGAFVFADNTTSIAYDANGNLDTFQTDNVNNAFLRAGVNNSATWRVTGGFRIFTSSNLSTGVTFQSGALPSNWGQSNAVISTSTGALLTTGGVWQNASSRALKDNFAAVDARAILRKVLSLPIQTWNYKAEGAGIRHIGPFSQDFKKTFDFGVSDDGIGTVDADGVALAAIQGLNEKLDERTSDLQKENEALKQRVERQQATIDALRKLVCANNPGADICQ